jgi:endonuclease/exonuclease/phosphatase family metal-dependent hydrolase
MTSIRIYINKYYSELALISIIFLFFLELIADFVEAVYALCLLTLSLNENVLTVLFLFSPVLLIFFRSKGSSNFLFLLLGELLVLCRVLESLFVNITQLKMIFAGLGVGCFLMLFPLMLYRSSNRDERETSITLGVGLTIALMISILFRVFGNTIDISTHDIFQIIGWILAIIASFMLIGHYIKAEGEFKEKISDSDIPSESITSWKQVLQILGLISILILLYFAFSSPTGISRWTEGNYLVITTIIMLVLTILTMILLYNRDILNKVNLWMIWVINGVFVLSLLLTIVLHQVPFPPSETSYPLNVPPTTILHDLILLVMLVTSPTLIISFILFSRQIMKFKPTILRLSGNFAIASFFLILMIFSHVFTTVYDYIPEIGPFFRDKFWFVHFLVGLGIILPILLVNEKDLIFKQPITNIQVNLKALLIGMITFSSIIGLIMTSPYPSSPEGSSLKVLTYNIRQGYSEDGIKNFDGQLEILKQVDADVIGLQESDPARISGGNCDPVRYFANQLNLHSYYGPKTVTGTFGIALLSKYPIKSAKTFFMYSIGEQTACIMAQIEVGTTTFNVLVTHLGNDGPIIQQEQILDEVTGKNNVILIGDFNFRPYTEQYNRTIAVLDDSWTVRWPSWVDDADYNASMKIDHIFVSLGTAIEDTRIIESMASDHPAVWAIIEI